MLFKQPSKNQPKKILNNKGESLVQVLVSLAISAIVIGVVMQITGEQTKSLKYFSQKSESIDLRNFVSQALNSSAVCDWQFAAKGVVLNPSSLGSQTISFDKLYSGINASSPAVVEVGGKLSGLAVSSIVFKDIVATGSPNLYSGDIEISFDQSTAARPIAAQKIRKTVSVDATRRIVACAGSTASGVTSAITVVGTWGKGIRAMTCPTDYLMSMCHAEVNSSDGMSMMFLQRLTFSGPPNKLTTCTGTMNDSNDVYRIIMICIK